MADPIKDLMRMIGDMTPLTRVVAGILERAVEQNFQTSGSRVGGWPALSVKYADLLRRKGKDPAKMLNRSQGGLMHSISSRYDSTSATVGASKVYARVHQQGAVIQHAARSENFTRKRKTKGPNKGKFKKGVVLGGPGASYKAYSVEIPARPFLKLNEDDKRKIADTVARYLAK